jgi:hypothetical protein
MTKPQRNVTVRTADVTVTTAEDLPQWKQFLREGNDDDRQIWKFFVMQRLNMEQAAREAPPWSMASQGGQLPQMFGAIARLSLEGVKRLCQVMSTYGVMLLNGQDVGDVVHPPWSGLPFAPAPKPKPVTVKAAPVTVRPRCSECGAVLERQRRTRATCSDACRQQRARRRRTKGGA